MGLSQKERLKTLRARKKSDYRPRRHHRVATYCSRTAPRCSKEQGCSRRRVGPRRAPRHGCVQGSGWLRGSGVNEAAHLDTKEERKKKKRTTYQNCVISSWLSHCRVLGCDVRKMENNKQAPNANTNDPLPSPLKNQNHHHSQRVLFSKRNLI